MLQLVQSTLRHQIRVRRASSRSELLHQLQQVQNFLLANVPSLTAHSHKTGWDSVGAASVTALLKLNRSFERKTGNSSLQNPATRALVLIVLVILVSVYVGTSPVRRGFLYYTGILAPSVVAAIASGLWTWSWKWSWLMLGACSALTILIQILLYLLQ